MGPLHLEPSNVFIQKVRLEGGGGGQGGGGLSRVGKEGWPISTRRTISNKYNK
jgi:hypothetical protein